MSWTVTISPAWPWILAMSAIAAAGYAALVRRLNDHPRYGRFWERQSWVEVVIGNLLIAGSAWAVAGWQALLLLLTLNVVWGGPMIVGTLISHAREAAEAEDERYTREGQGAGEPAGAGYPPRAI
jgi:hypothetical protein